MTSIRIQSADRTWSADTTEGARVFRIGRDESADIVTTDPAVSRRHAEIRALGEGWEVVDVGSSLGTWVNGRRVDRSPLVGTTAIGFGDQGRSFQVTVTVVPAASAPAPAPPAPAPQAGFPPPVAAPPTYAAPGGLHRAAPQAYQPAPTQQIGIQPPYGQPGNPLLEQTVVGLPPVPGGFNGFPGPGLLVRRRLDGDLRFPPGTPVRIGRDPSLEVHADDSAVSRLHAVVEPRPDGWWWVDRSTSGTFVDGEQMTSFKIEEPTEISLGHPTAGYEIEVVPVVAAGQAVAEIRSRKRRRSLLVVAAVLVGLLAVSGLTWGGFALLGGDEEPAPFDQQAALDRAKAASVLLQAVDDSGQVLWSGSGSIITDTGLILTNAHVGDPDAPGQGSSEQDPAFLEVSLTNGDDDAPAKATYRANPIVSDGYLDFAVLQINADVDGTELAPDDIEGLPEPLPIGDSDELRTGDRITALGYPAIGNVTAQGDRPLTVTEGVVSTFQADEVVGTERGSIDSDVRLGSGNSGGASINERGEIIGLNTRVITAASMDAGSITQGSALIVPVNLAEAVIEIAKDGGDPDYVSPYLDSMPTDPGLPTGATAVANGWVTDDQGDDCSGSSSPESPSQLDGVEVDDTVLAQFTLEGVPAGLPLSVDFYLADGTRVDSLTGAWDGDESATCISAPLTIKDDVPGVTARLSLGQDGEVAAENPVVFGGP